MLRVEAAEHIVGCEPQEARLLAAVDHTHAVVAQLVADRAVRQAIVHLLQQRLLVLSIHEAHARLQSEPRTRVRVPFELRAYVLRDKRALQQKRTHGGIDKDGCCRALRRRDELRRVVEDRQQVALERHSRRVLDIALAVCGRAFVGLGDAASSGFVDVERGHLAGARRDELESRARRQLPGSGRRLAPPVHEHARARASRVHHHRVPLLLLRDALRELCRAPHSRRHQSLGNRVQRERDVELGLRSHSRTEYGKKHHGQKLHSIRQIATIKLTIHSSKEFRIIIQAKSREPTLHFAMKATVKHISI